jgi:hypothetical protein
MTIRLRKIPDCTWDGEREGKSEKMPKNKVINLLFLITYGYKFLEIQRIFGTFGLRALFFPVLMDRSLLHPELLQAFIF